MVCPACRGVDLLGVLEVVRRTARVPSILAVDPSVRGPQQLRWVAPLPLRRVVGTGPGSRSAGPAGCPVCTRARRSRPTSVRSRAWSLPWSSTGSARPGRRCPRRAPKFHARAVVGPRRGGRACPAELELGGALGRGSRLPSGQTVGEDRRTCRTGGFARPTTVWGERGEGVRACGWLRQRGPHSIASGPSTDLAPHPRDPS